MVGGLITSTLFTLLALPDVLHARPSDGKRGWAVRA